MVFNQLGLAVQNGSMTEIMEDASFSQNLALVVMILLAIYYVVANILCFYAYREFKGMLFDVDGQGGNFGMGQRARGGGQERSQSEDNANRGFAQAAPAASSGGGNSGSGGGFKSFQGKGVTIGGS